MATKANWHPLVRELRGLLKRQKLAGAVLITIDHEGHTLAASAGHNVAACNALGPVLDESEIEMIKFAMWEALRDLTPRDGE